MLTVDERRLASVGQSNVRRYVRRIRSALRALLRKIRAQRVVRRVQVGEKLCLRIAFYLAVCVQDRGVADGVGQRRFRDRTDLQEIIVVLVEAEHERVAFGNVLRGKRLHKRGQILDRTEIEVVHADAALFRDLGGARIDGFKLFFRQKAVVDVHVRSVFRVRRKHGEGKQKRNQKQRTNAFHRQPPPYTRKCPRRRSPPRIPANSPPYRSRYFHTCFLSIGRLPTSLPVCPFMAKV